MEPSDATQAEGQVLCQKSSCPTQETATRVCHHPQCTETNQDFPLQLCRQCDQYIHKQPQYQGHLVLDCNRKLPIILRPHPPTPTPTPTLTYDDADGGGSESDTSAAANYSDIPEEPIEEDKLFVKHSSKSRSRSPRDIGRKLQRKKAVKKKNSTGNEALDAVLAQIADPEGNMDTDTVELARPETDAPRVTIDSISMDGLTSEVSLDFTDGPSSSQNVVGNAPRTAIRRQSWVMPHDTHFTLKFSSSKGQREDIEIVPAMVNTTLRVAIESVLQRRNIGMNNINVFIEKSGTPLPLSSDSSFLAGNTLEIKEKDERDGETGSQPSTSSHKQRTNSTSKSGSGKASKQSGRNSRRDSVGVVPTLLEPPPTSTKQRRGSLQLPFREHFFAKNDPKPDPIKGASDDNFGSLRGRTRGGGNLSIDESIPIPTTSPQGTWTEGKKNKGQKLSVVNLFGPPSKDRERQEQLNEILGRYSNGGLPRVPELLAFGRVQFDETIFEMEDHWKQVVNDHQQLSRRQQEHQEAVWELLNTEVSYLKQIRVIIDVFQNCLINIQQEGLLNEIETERLFSNIDKIYECNACFWQDYLLPVVCQGRKIGLPLDIINCKEAFTVHFPNMFQVYFKYFIEHKSSLDYAKSCMDNGELFKTFIVWAETQKPCNRLKMADILVKPMQRLLKYSLLLQAIFKLTDDEKDKKELREMIIAVDKLCWAANNSLQRREDFEKLEAVRKTIENYDAIEAPNDECAKIIQEYNGNFNLLAPMKGFRDGQPRNLLLHSNMRLKEAQAAKMDIDCLLFTDLILICKSNRKMDRFKVIRPPMSLDQLVVCELKDKGSVLLIYTNEYHVPISAFTFHSDIGVIRSWMEKFKDAQKDYKRRKMEESAKLERMHLNAISAQEEVECTPLNPPNANVDINLPRSDSVESTDRFLPNLLTPNSQHDNSELGRCSSTGDIQNRLGSQVSDNEYNSDKPPMSSGKNTSLMYTSTDHCPNVSKDKRSTNATRLVDMQSPIKGNFHLCQSSPAFSSPSNTTNTVISAKNLPSDNPDNCNPVIEVNNRNVSFMDSDTHQGHQDWLMSQTSINSDQNSVFEDDGSKIRHHSRRMSRNEKRYHTADAIQDIKNQEKDKDNSIHKRLSLRTGDEPPKNLGSTDLSSDSVLSIRSSSGVSSTGSLHINPEVNEEIESNNTNNNTVKERSASTNQFSASNNINNNNNMNYPTIQMDPAFINSAGPGYSRLEDDDNDMMSGLEPDSRQLKSRSTSDLSNMFSQMQVSQLQDGIASVAMVNETFQRKLTHADILKMKRLKQQILYDANIESSEV